jgi:hypothetical protein
MRASSRSSPFRLKITSNSPSLWGRATISTLDVEGAQQVSLVLAFGGQPVDAREASIGSPAMPYTSRGAPQLMRRTASIERRRSAIACASGMDDLGQEIFPRSQQTPEALATFQKAERSVVAHYQWPPISRWSDRRSIISQFTNGRFGSKPAPLFSARMSPFARCGHCSARGVPLVECAILLLEGWGSGSARHFLRPSLS